MPCGEAFVKGPPDKSVGSKMLSRNAKALFQFPGEKSLDVPTLQEFHIGYVLTYYEAIFYGAAHVTFYCQFLTFEV